MAVLLGSAWLAQIGLVGSSLYGSAMVVEAHYGLLSKRSKLCFQKKSCNATPTLMEKKYITIASSCVANSCRWTKRWSDITLCVMRSTRTLHALASRIKELRVEKHISQEELAHRSGLSRTGMGFLETGKRWPRLDTLMSVAEGLSISVDELLKGVHKPPRKR